MNEIKTSLLKTVGYQLFGGERPRISADIFAVLEEAKAQTVFTGVFPFFRAELQQSGQGGFVAAQEIFFGNVIKNTNNFMEHDELNKLMTNNDIPYCTLKGLASAYYYPDPSLREMGDVDYLVQETDFEKAKQVALNAGFAIDHGDEPDSIHIAFKREPMSIWEQHRTINGIPNGEVGENIQLEIDRTIKTSEQITLDGVICRIPDAFHHGLIMLLHVASHMTSEGIGLRHLCDWAVFANRLGNDGFDELFEEKLTRFGLWKFAQILTLVSEKYLGIAHMEWAQNPEVTDEHLEAVMEDIMNGGNFGKKDLNRYREIKYISNRGERTVDNKNVVDQVFGTLNQKTCSDYPWIKKHKVFLPIGWAAEGGRYLALLITGKRKSKGTSAMLREAAKRKEIYSKMELFRINE